MPKDSGNYAILISLEYLRTSVAQGGHTLGPSLSEGLAAVFFGGKAGSPFLARRKNKTSDTQDRVDIKSRIFLLFIYLKVVNLVPMAFFPSWG